MGENKKSAKNGFPPRGKTKNQRKILSQNWENEKMWKIGIPKLGKNKKMEENGCPNIGKTEKRRKMAFPNLGRIKNLKGCISQPLEEQKYCWELFQPLGRAIFSVFHSSNSLDERFFSFFIHPTPWTSSFSCFSFIRVLGRAVFPIFHSSESSDG